VICDGLSPQCRGSVEFSGAFKVALKFIREANR
jgi:hypothetical protein